MEELSRHRINPEQQPIAAPQTHVPWQDNSSRLEFFISAIISGGLAGMEQVEKSGHCLRMEVPMWVVIFLWN